MEMEQEIPVTVELRDISAHYNRLTIPRRLKVYSTLSPEWWGKVIVEEGAVNLYCGETGRPIIVTPEASPSIPPETRFKLEGMGIPVRFYLAYYHERKLDDAAELSALLAERPGANA